jgi:hypothetical protein
MNYLEKSRDGVTIVSLCHGYLSSINTRPDSATARVISHQNKMEVGCDVDFIEDMSEVSRVFMNY